MKGVLPWAVVLVAIAAVIWWQLDREMTAGKWLLGGVLLAHGLVHLLFAVSGPETSGTKWPFDMGRSWAITGADLSPSTVKAVGWAIIAITVAGFALAALSTVGIIVPASWWQPAVVTSALTSAIALVLFFDPQLILGLGIDAVLLWIGVTGIWVP